MVDALLIITSVAVILFVGLISSWLGNRLRIPDVLLLIIAGMLLGSLKFRGAPLIELPPLFLSSVAILALAMIVFDSTARLRLREIDTFSGKALKLTLTWLLFHVVLFSIVAHYMMKLSFWPSILFATIVAGTSPDVLVPIISKSKVPLLLKLESVFNTPFTVILPFLVLDLMNSVTTSILSDLMEQLVPFIMKFIVGLGAGIFVGIVLFKVVQKAHAELYSSLAVIIAALFAYVLAENLGGNGVLAVTALGLFFGNVYVKEKPSLLSAESVLTKALYIFVFIGIGIIIQLPFTKEFFFISGTLFLVYTFIRYLAVWASTTKGKYTTGEMLFMTLNIPKGIATATVVFILAVQQIEGIATILDYTLAFLLYSIVLSSIVTWASKWFLHENSAR